ncbi:excreted virulence factor EspC (type VII ESX diderm) [Krasilnikovia cinnamomea]|uniref:Excreted virulence factor EspC (Type VII ESX diderm) n=1 Tax=Krasilnikovia cinnamomea TaxID=349313 RepID=A0A4Q7ZG95_9ACTN|nr:excreted virulence factor EspC (type VII ESX diderm) [Krasilnikovia cinnamomea]
MGYPTGQVDPAALERVGAAVQQSSAKFSKAFGAHAGQVGAVGALRGWGTGDALAEAEHAWSTFVGNLAAQVDAHGASLSQSAREYTSTDRAAAGRVTAAGHLHPGVR